MLKSREIKGSARPDLGLGGIRRCALEVGPVLTIDGMNSMWEVFENSYKQYPKNPCLGYRPILEKTGEALDYVWLTYKEVYHRAINFSSGLVHLGICPENGDGMNLLGFYSKNRVEYIIADLAAYSQNIIPVPMYDTLGVETVEYVVNQTELKTTVCTEAEIERVFDLKGLISTAILMDGEFLKPEKVAVLKEAGQAAGVEVLTMTEVEQVGKENPKLLNLPSNMDIGFFCYTSGTTGPPKGALIRHSGLISCLASAREYGLEMFPTDVHLSYLPLPHVFERSILYACLYGGGSVAFYQGDTLKILEDLQAARPTIFPSVPRLLNRVYDKLLAGVREAGGIKQWLFETALESKIGGLRKGTNEHFIWDRLVFKGVKQKIGLDRIRQVMTGSAPISGTVLDFLRAVLGCPVTEGYGQTESSMLISFTEMDDYSVGHVGIPAPCNEIRLISVPDMNYLVTDTEHSDGTPCLGRGEIAFRGPNVFAGYYKMPEKTAETITKDGWCLTGDIGIWTKEGKLKIVDRKKSLTKLAQGEYVSPEKVEGVIARSPLVASSFVHGDSLQSFLVCVIVPDAEVLEAKNMAVDSEETKKAIFQEMLKQCKEAQLHGFEIPKAIHIEPLPFDQESPSRPKLTTPTFKLKRAPARDFYKDAIDAMYDSVPKSKL